MVFCHAVQGQNTADTTAAKHTVDSVNRLLDRSVVKKDLPALRKHYAGDFFFQHATGKIDSKESWLKGAMNPQNDVQSREHDSVTVELHQNVAVVTGTLSVRYPPQTRDSYAVRYLRVFVYRDDRWQLVSHHSSLEWKLKAE